MMRVFRAILRVIGRGIRAVTIGLGALVISGGVIVYADYLATVPGSGTTFASVVISLKHYAAMVICDATAGESQCLAVDSSGRLTANQQIWNGSAWVNSVGDATNGTKVQVTQAVGLATGSATSTSTGSLIMCAGQNAEQTSVSNGQNANIPCGIEGKPIFLPYAVKELWVRGNGTQTGTSPTTVLAASGSASLKTYAVSAKCYNTGATGSVLTFNDSASTQIFVPAGGGNNQTFPIPLVTSANTALTFTPGSASTTIGCSAQGYYGS